MSACSMLYFLCLPTIPTTKPSWLLEVEPLMRSREVLRRAAGTRPSPWAKSTKASATLSVAFNIGLSDPSSILMIEHCPLASSLWIASPASTILDLAPVITSTSQFTLELTKSRMSVLCLLAILNFSTLFKFNCSAVSWDFFLTMFLTVLQLSLAVVLPALGFTRNTPCTRDGCCAANLKAILAPAPSPHTSTLETRRKSRMLTRPMPIVSRLGKVSRSGAPGLCPGSATWRNTARFATFVCMSIIYNDQHQHHLSHVLLLVEVDPVLVGGAYCVQGQEDVARNLHLLGVSLDKDRDGSNILNVNDKLFESGNSVVAGQTAAFRHFKSFESALL